MKLPFQLLLQHATELTKAGRLTEATEHIRRALSNATSHAPIAPTTSPSAFQRIDHAPAVTVNPAATIEPHANQGVFSAGAHTHAARTMRYRLYTPAGAANRPRPLVVMLHGCTQDPADFAAGTAMNRRADADGLVVLYPAQAQDANPQRCWNWFKPGDQQRDRGEPALIATLTQAIIHQHDIDAHRVYICGLSAGGAMAAIVATAYPELFAALGVHSGLAQACAKDLSSALAVMRSGEFAQSSQRADATAVPTIVFHGDRDRTVHPRNGERVLQAALAGVGATRAEHTHGTLDGGHRYTQTVYRATPSELSAAEHWVIHGGGHAWSGGSAAGSYTDAKGPDATSEMLRFFFEHRRP